MPMMSMETPQATMFAIFPVLPPPASGGPHSTSTPTGAMLGSARRTPPVMDS